MTAQEIMESSSMFVFLYFFIEALAESTSFIYFEEYTKWFIFTLISLMLIGDGIVTHIENKIIERTRD
jgi:predicted transporter